MRAASQLRVTASAARQHRVIGARQLPLCDLTGKEWHGAVAACHFAWPPNVKGVGKAREVGVAVREARKLGVAVREARTVGVAVREARTARTVGVAVREARTVGVAVREART
eukprot:362509-Chlamydomonas_euryale.AAC.2